MSHPRLAALALAALACSTPGPVRAVDCTACSGPYSVQVVDDAGRPLPAFSHRGRTHVVGTRGARYLLRVRNQTGRRVEVVASVDGRDVVDGKPAAVAKPGYVVPPWGEVVIDGFRLSEEAVAAFRFGTVERSYAARMGDARDVGVIGVAFFPEAAPPRPEPVPFLDPEADGRRGAAGDDAAPAASAPAASSGEPSRSAAKEERPGLGTSFGERHESHVVEVAFERASAAPAAVLTVRYDDRPGLLALGIDVDGRRISARDRRLRDTAEPFRSDRFAEPPAGWNPDRE